MLLLQEEQCAAQEQEELQCQEDIARQYQANLLLQEERCAAQEQEELQHQEDIARQNQANLLLQEEQRAALEQEQQRQVEASQIQQEKPIWQQEFWSRLHNFTVQLTNGQQQEVEPIIYVKTGMVRQSPKTAGLMEMSKKGKESNRDSAASQRKKKQEGIRKSKRINVDRSVENEVHGNKVQHAAPSAAEHRAEMERFDVIENDLRRDLEGIYFGEAG
jgi:hypothetical protein